MNLLEVARELARRLVRLFVPDERGRRPCHGSDRLFNEDPHWRDLVLFHEYYHGDTGRGVGASHQTGWTALAVRCVEDTARARAAGRAAPDSRAEREEVPAAITGGEQKRWGASASANGESQV